MLGIYAVGLAAWYFLLIKPQRKKQKEAKAMLMELKAGDYVQTSSGLFGKIASVGGDCFLVEFGSNKTVIIPISKSEIVGNRQPNLSTAVPEAIVEKKEPKVKKDKV
jgi:preprotein translocase subunit YajC